MTPAKVVVRPGQGVVARYGGGMLVLLPGGAPEVGEQLMAILRDVCEGQAAPGRAFARRVVGLLSQADPDSVPAFAAVSSAEQGWAVILHGGVELQVTRAGGVERLSGYDASTWVDRIVEPGFSLLDVMPVGGGAGDVDPRFDLSGGVVPGAGLQVQAEAGGATAAPAGAAGSPAAQESPAAAVPGPAPAIPEPAPAPPQPTWEQQPGAQAWPPQAPAPQPTWEQPQPQPQPQSQTWPQPQPEPAQQPAAWGQQPDPGQQPAWQAQPAPPDPGQQPAWQAQPPQPEPAPQPAWQQPGQPPAPQPAWQQPGQQAGGQGWAQQPEQPPAPSWQQPGQEQGWQPQQQPQPQQPGQEQGWQQQPQPQQPGQEQGWQPQPQQPGQEQGWPQQPGWPQAEQPAWGAQPGAAPPAAEPAAPTPAQGGPPQEAGGPPAWGGAAPTPTLEEPPTLIQRGAASEPSPPPAPAQAPAAAAEVEEDLPFEYVQLTDVPESARREALPVLSDDQPKEEAVEDSDAPLVYGVLSPAGYFNHPDALYCAVTGVSMLQRTHVLVQRPRPPLGVVVADDGSTFTLDQNYVVGREPEREPLVAAKEARPLKLVDAERSLSRVHAEIRLIDWDVYVVDRGSANGTYVLPRDAQQWKRLVADSPEKVQPGTRIAFGKRVMTFESHHQINPRAQG